MSSATAAAAKSMQKKRKVSHAKTIEEEQTALQSEIKTVCSILKENYTEKQIHQAYINYMEKSENDNS